MKNYILGSIRKIIFESNTGPYKVGLFKVKETNDEDMIEYIDKVIGFTGSFNEINEDVDYILYGNMVIHPKYGLQYSVESYEISLPKETDSIILYLSSGLFKGIGVKTAKRIVDVFGEDTINVIKDSPEDISLISGMNMKKAMMIHDKICDNEMNQELIIKLNTLGFTTNEAIKLTTLYGIELMDIIENDIYELIEEVNFDKLDLIFLKNNDEMDKRRIKALIKHNIYTMCYESGDTLINREELFVKMKRCFNKNLSVDKFLSHLNELINENEIVSINDMVCLFNFYETEVNILKDINRIDSIKDMIDSSKLDKHIKNYEKKNKITFDEEQKEAIKGSLKNNFFIITGGPGTGKTTIIKAIVDILMDIKKIRKDDIALLAPTGRSAKRMSESVGVSAYTIHKFL